MASVAGMDSVARSGRDDGSGAGWGESSDNRDMDGVTGAGWDDGARGVRHTKQLRPLSWLMKVQAAQGHPGAGKAAAAGAKDRRLSLKRPLEAEGRFGGSFADDDTCLGGTGASAGAGAGAGAGADGDGDDDDDDEDEDCVRGKNAAGGAEDTGGDDAAGTGAGGGDGSRAKSALSASIHMLCGARVRPGRVRTRVGCVKRRPLVLKQMQGGTGRVVLTYRPCRTGCGTAVFP